VLCRFEGNAEEIRSEVHSMQQQVRVLAGEKEDLHHQLHSEQQRSRQHLAQVITSDHSFQAWVLYSAKSIRWQSRMQQTCDVSFHSFRLQASLSCLCAALVL